VTAAIRQRPSGRFGSFIASLFDRIVGGNQRDDDLVSDAG
jgi:hypothetical protein